MIKIQGKYGEIIFFKTSTISTFIPLNGFELEAEYTNHPTKSRVLLNATYQEKNLFGELKHTRSEDNIFPASGEITLKTPIDFLKYLKGNYEVNLDDGVLDASIFLTRNEKDTIDVEIDGLIQDNSISADIGIKHTFGSKEKIQISTFLRRNNTVILNNISIQSGENQVISELKLKQHPYLKFDYKLEGKIPSPINLRIAYTNTDTTKVLKSEMKYQNSHFVTRVVF